MIKLEGIFKAYPDKVLFENFSLTVNDGEKICFTGVSGRGKTTLLRMMTGLEQPDRGTVLISPGTKFSYLFQEDRLLPGFSLVKNMTAVGIPPERARAYLEKVMLSGEESTLPHKLSGGMARRAALARALAAEYDTVYLDEPFTGQDEGTKKLLIELLKKELEGKTALIITHDDGDLSALADRTVEL